MVEELLHEKILFWLEVMSILGVTTGAISGLAKFKAWAKVYYIVIQSCTETDKCFRGKG
jgi:hypothetical protein